jgi:hypothetical protein
MTKRSYKLRARRRQRQEGAALLIVLFVLMMATTTAVYTLSSTQFEVRAAGALHQAMRAKFVSEAATTGVVGLCYQLTSVGCLDLKRANGNLETTLRRTYALPNGGLETVYSITKDDFVGPAYQSLGAMVADDKTISGVSSGGVASAWTPTFLSVMEKWELGEPGQASQKLRVIVSTYGTLDIAGDVKGTDELRNAHSTISATRAYIDIRN